jgi:hypothetical protein
VSFALIDRALQLRSAQQTYCTVAWARQLPINGNLRSFVLELAFLFDEKPDAEWIDISDKDMAARCHIQERTVWNLQPQLRGIVEVDRCDGRITRYRRPRLATSEKLSEVTYEKVSEVPHNFRESPTWAFSLPLSVSPLPHTCKSSGEKRERAREPATPVPSVEQLVTPELLEYAKRERGFTPQQTEFVMKKLVLEYSDGRVRRNWPEIGQKWILTEKVDSTEQGRMNERSHTISSGSKPQSWTKAMHRYMAPDLCRDEETAERVRSD